MQFDGKERNGKIYVPKSYTGEKPFSLVLALHGNTRSAENFWTYGFNEYADKYDFIVVYPNGYNRTWEVNPAAPTGGNDTEFLKNLIEEMENQYSIDPQRIYATGHSLGAFMANRLACVLGDKITAIAPVEGLVIKPQIESSKPSASFFHIHAADDNVVYKGGFPNSFTIEEGAREWSQALGLDGEGEEFIYSNERIGRSWSNETKTVQYLIYPEGGHAWLRGAT